MYQKIYVKIKKNSIFCHIIDTNICSYRIEHVMNMNIRQNISLKNKILITDGIICAIDIHRQAMKFVFTFTIFIYIYI